MGYPAMPELKTFALTCPGCGAALKVGESVDSFACAYCGASVRVEHGEGIVSLRLLTDAISNVQRGTDRTASELALGWWSIPVIMGGLFVWWKSITTLSDKMKPIQRDAAAKLAPLKAQIAKHHAIVDS